AVLSDKDISEMLDAHIKDILSDFAGTEYAGEPQFELFGGKITVDKNEARCRELEKGIALAQSLEKEMEPNTAVFESCGIDFDIKKYIAKLFAGEAEKCGVKAAESEFSGCPDIAAMGDKLKKLVSEKNGYGFKYSEPDKAKIEKMLRDAEMFSEDAEGVKKSVSELLIIRPVYPCVFNLARATSPTDAENVENISEYWGVSPLSPIALADYLAEAYVPADFRSPDGTLTCGGAKAGVIMEDLKTASAKYKLKVLPILDELSAYCENFEKQSRTYNGTLFDTVEDMEKAVKNEKELADLCADLTALDEKELKKLRQYIYDMKLDKKTTGRYLLKIKLALNDCEKNQLEILCTGISLKKTEELEALKKKIAEGGFDETVSAPYIAQINDGILSAQLRELTEMFKSIPDAAKADSLEKALSSGKYDAVFKRHFALKIADARNVFAKAEIAEICKGVSSADEKQLKEISAKLDAVKCSESLKNSYKKEISARFAALEEQAAAKAFEGIASADKQKLAQMTEIIKSGKFRAELTDKYATQIGKREIE
ncbi:MAG: hypothetical protein J6A60_03255, partial [Clostridia bacterium]|nr:hypothetical protein [Clostridia bacterium]